MAKFCMPFSILSFTGTTTKYCGPNKFTKILQKVKVNSKAISQRTDYRVFPELSMNSLVDNEQHNAHRTSLDLGAKFCHRCRIC